MAKKQTVKIGGKTLTVEHPELLDSVFEWMAERHRIFERRLSGAPRPWTEDRVLESYSFCNVYRILDRNTQFLLNSVINCGGCQEHPEVCFRIILFRLFNRIETWELLVKKLGPMLSWTDFDLESYEDVLQEAADAGTALYTSSYIIVAPDLGGGRNFRNSLRLLKSMMESKIHEKLLELNHLFDAFNVVTLYSGMGSFLAFQLCLDLNLAPAINWDEDEWAAPGPGSSECLDKIFGHGVHGLESEAMKWLSSIQGKHWKRIGYRPVMAPNAKRRGVTVVDLEHSLCEVEKWARVTFPKIAGKKKEIKAKYHPHKNPRKEPSPVTAYLPAKWTVPDCGLLVELAPLDALESLSDTSQHNDSSQDEEVDYDGQSYEVSHIVTERPYGKTGRQYRIRWTGWSPQWDEWIPEDELAETAPDVLHDWKMKRSSIAGALANAQKGRRVQVDAKQKKAAPRKTRSTASVNSKAQR